MPVLDCSVRTCSYNAEDKCSLDSIKVEGSNAEISESTSCASFKKRSGDSYSSSQRSPQNALDIDCKAQKCTFNESMKCQAEHIGIAGGSAKTVHETECSSFYKE